MPFGAVDKVDVNSRLLPYHHLGCELGWEVIVRFPFMGMAPDSGDGPTGRYRQWGEGMLFQLSTGIQHIVFHLSKSVFVRIPFRRLCCQGDAILLFSRLKLLHRWCTTREVVRHPFEPQGDSQTVTFVIVGRRKDRMVIIGGVRSLILRLVINQDTIVS